MKKFFICFITVLILFSTTAQDLNLKRVSEQELKARKEALEQVHQYLLNAKKGEGGAFPVPTPATTSQHSASGTVQTDQEVQDNSTTSLPKFEVDDSKSSRKHSEALRKQIQEMYTARGASSSVQKDATSKIPPRPELIKKDANVKAFDYASQFGPEAQVNKPESGWKGRRPAAGKSSAAGQVIKKVPTPKRAVPTGKSEAELKEEIELRKAEFLSDNRAPLTREQIVARSSELSQLSNTKYASQKDKGNFQGEVNASDSLALTAIRSALSGLATYWSDSLPISSWPGVWLNGEGRVFGISIYNFGVSGTFPDELGNLTELTSLEFGENFGITSLPSTLVNLTKLTTISAFNNQLSALPAGFETLKRIKFLDLGGNRFEGPMPEGIFELDSLQNLYFWYNDLTSIGEGFGNLTMLEHISISGNQFESMPSSIQNLDKVWHLELQDNNLKKFPDEIAGMQNLEYLYLYSNEIFDEIPPAYFSDLTKLRLFDITNNRVFGAIPSTIGQADSLEYLYCANNVLNKTLPVELGGLANIIQINFSENLIPGAIPAELGQATTLETFYAPFNKLTGELPVELGELANLREFAVYYNEGMSGGIPDSFGNLQNLYYLDLDGCGLSGTLPASMGNMTSLSDLWLRENQFSGSIPDSLGRGLFNLGYLMIEYNEFTGLPTDVSALSNLNQFWARANQLEFDDFEPFMQLPFVILDINQQESELEILYPSPGSSVELNATVGGSKNVYEWHRNGEYLGTFESGTFQIENFSKEDAGYYYTWIYSDSVYQLTMYKEFEVYYYEEVSAQDSLALVALYEATTPYGDGGWERDDHWLESPVAMWEGVIVEDGRVVGLDLEYNNLRGGIPPQIADLTALRHLNLFGNHVNYVASEFYSLTNLTYLDLDDNDLRGGISPLIANLTNLDTLWLGANDWEAPIPEELYTLTKLRVLGLYSGRLTGQLSPLIGNLTELRYLNMNNNNLSGALPAELPELVNLEYLYLGGNQRFEPGIPDLSQLSSLKDLSISQSPLLQGQIPSFIGNMENLQRIYLGGNDLSSGMESLSILMGMSNLVDVSLENCNISGEFPYTFDQMDSLEWMVLAGNQLTGFTGGSIQHDGLRGLFLQRNLFTVLPDLATPSLELLYLDDNQLTSLPDVSNLSSLNQVSAPNNRLTFDDLIPLEYFFTNPQNYFSVAPQAPLSKDTAFYLPAGGSYDITFIHVDTSSTTFASWYKESIYDFNLDIVPSFNGDFFILSEDTLQITNAENPGDDGYYYAELYNDIITPYTGLVLQSGVTGIQVLEQIDQSDSLALVAIFEHFDGHLWDDKDGWLEDPVENWAGVEAFGGRVRGLYLYGMYGEIPAAITDLDSLEYLQIVDGYLTGEIPDEIFNLQRLRWFDVGGNFLIGSIPETVGNATQLETFGIRGNHLTGSIPESMGNLQNLNNFWVDQNGFNNAYLEGSIPEGWADNQWEHFYIQNNRFNELPAGLDTALQSAYEAFFFYNDFDMNDLIRGVGISANNGGVHTYPQHYRRKLSGEIVEGEPVVLSVERLHPNDEFNWYIQYPWNTDPGYSEYLAGTATDSFLIIPDWVQYENARIYVGVVNYNISGYEEYSNVVTINTNNRRFASGGEYTTEVPANLRTPISSITGPPDNFPWDWQLRNWWHNQSQPNFDTLTLFFNDPIPVNYFRHHGYEINLRSIALKGSGGEEVRYQVNRTFVDQYGYQINKFPKTPFAVSEVELIINNGSMDAFEIGDDGSEGILGPPFIDEAYVYTHGKDAGGTGNGYIGFPIFLDENYISGVVETYVERSTAPESGFTTIDTVNYSFYNDFDLPAPGTYYYRVRISIGGQVSDYSNVIKGCNVVSEIPGLGDPQDDGNGHTYSYWNVTSQGTGEFAGYTGKRDSVIFRNEYSGENNFFIEGPYHGGFFDQFMKYQDQEGTYFLDNCGELALYAIYSYGEFPADSLWGTYENDTLYLNWRDKLNGIIGLSKFVYVGPVEGEEEYELNKPALPIDLEVAVYSSDSVWMHWEMLDEFSEGDENYEYYQDFDDPDFFIIQRATGKTGAFADYDTVSVEEVWDRDHYALANLKDNQLYRYRVYAGNSAGLSYPSDERGVVHQIPMFDPLISFGGDRYSYGAAFGDIDNDGDQDLYIANAFENGYNQLFENLGNGVFNERSTTVATQENAFSRSASFGDYDNDGFADLYVPGGQANDVDVFVKDRIYRNTGAKSFQVTNTELISTYETGEAGVWVDLDKDGFLDLVTTLGYVFRNKQDGTFETIDTLRGFEGGMIHLGFTVMTMTSFDFDKDGDEDIYATSEIEGNRLYLNDGTGNMTLKSDISISNGDLGSRGAVWFDADNDSDLDLFIGDQQTGLYVNNGSEFTYRHISTIIDLPYDDGDITGGRGATSGDFNNDGFQDLAWVVEGRPYLLLNNGDLSFHVIDEGEQRFPEMSFGTHISTADVNNDGFLDLLFLNGVPDGGISNYMYLNNGNANGWVNVTLKGVNSNASGIGAKVFATAGGETQFATVTSQNGIGSGNSLSVEFGLGSASAIENLRVEWPSGDVTELTNVSSNQFLSISELVPVNSADSIALAAFYQATGGADWTNNTGWADDRPARDWYGVFFNKDGRVTSLVLNNNNLTGSIPASITSMTFLEVLDLSGNALTKGLPADLGNLTALKSISLNDNALEGGIPAAVSSLVNLQNVDLYNNQMSGELPVNVGNLTVLKQFEIQNNQFIGFLPESFGTLNSLEVLNISNNRFEGEIPSGLGGAENLQVLNISRNNFIGNLPEGLGQLENLVQLSVNNNLFSGELPAAFANLGAVELIDLSNNDFTGSLAPLANLASVSQINATNNEFTALADYTTSQADSVIVTFNYLDFGDFEANASAISAGRLKINPQDSLYDRIDSLHLVGEPISISFEVGGSLNTYRWFLDGQVLDGATTNEIIIQEPDTPNEGEYVLEIKNQLFPQITLLTSPFNLKLSSLERDRRALTALFNATRESGAWTNSTGWTTAENVDDWFGVTVNDDRVTRLELPTNNLDGRVPLEFADLSGLEVINLSGNSLRSFPDISKFSGLTDTGATVNISDNRLAFRDIIPNIGLGSILTYTPQKRYDITLNDTIQAGENYIVSVPGLASGSVYEWHFGPLIPGQLFNDNVTPITNANSRQYLVEAINYDKQGTYRVTITHPLVPGLTLTSRNRNLWASTDLFGSVYIDASNTPLDEGEVFIYRIKETGPYYLEDSVETAGGDYAFEDLVLGDFIVQVKPVVGTVNPEDNVPVQTYYEQTEDYVNADTLQVRERIDGVDIYMVFYTEPTPEVLGANLGGAISTDLEQGPTGGDEEDGRIQGRRKVAKAACSMRRFAGTGRTGQDEYELYAYVESDDEGRFSFTGIPDGEYLLNIQYPGVPMDPNSDIHFVLGGDRQEQEFELTVEITENGIEVVSREILYVLKPYIKDVKLYPNPTPDVLFADFVVNRKIDNLKLEVITVQGTRLMVTDLDHRMGAHRAKIDLTPYESGVYFMVFTDEAGTFRQQVKISKQ